MMKRGNLSFLSDGDNGYFINGSLYNINSALLKQGEIRIDRGYYAPSYPVKGKSYSEDGTLLYDGKFKITHQGSLGYPKVVFPEGFGSLH